MNERHPTTPDQLVLYVLREPGFLNQTLAAFAEAGLTAIEVMESQGVAELVDDEIPIFASFRHIFTGAQSYNYIVMGAGDEGQRTVLVERLQELLKDVSDEQRGVVFSVPLLFAQPLGPPT